MSPKKPEWRIIIDLLEEANPALYKRLGRRMMNYLFKKNITKIENIVLNIDKSVTMFDFEESLDDNQPHPRINTQTLEKLIGEVFNIAEDELGEQEITEVIRMWIKNENVHFLMKSAEKRDVAFDEIHKALYTFSNQPHLKDALTQEDRLGVRVALIRRFLSNNLSYINTLKDHITLDDFIDILNKTIGPSKGNGKLGGKAAGMIRAKQILKSKSAELPVLSEIKTPKTWFVTSDGIFEFLHSNALEEFQRIKYHAPVEIRREYPYIEQIFKNSIMPLEFISMLSVALDDFGDSPIIVRSSSLLEDSPEAAFAGKYKSLFVSNQGTKKERLEALIDAIEEVYASVFSPDVLEYRRENGLLDFNEEMALMIQEVVGTKVGKYYLPAFAGVAFTDNEFRWSPRIKKEDGIIRLVAGLGTRAVDRIGDDYPLLLCPGQPGLKVNSTPEETLHYSQKCVDVINLQTRKFESLPLKKMIEEIGYSLPGLTDIISLFSENQLHQAVGTMIDFSKGEPVITFSNLIKKGKFINYIKTMLDVLKKSLGYPVDIEFAYNAVNENFYLLQCRPQSHSRETISVSMPRDIQAEKILFTAKRYVTNGLVKDIRYIVLVDPSAYDSLEELNDLITVGKIISDLNSDLPKKSFILAGPGRWGSRGDIKLGVRVTYSDINNTAMLIEIAKQKKGYMPELSFGTHFFQDLVESQIKYLPLYPDDEDSVFNNEFFSHSKNTLSSLAKIPKDKKKLFESVVKVIDLEAESPGMKAEIVMDGDSSYAIAFLKNDDK
ncbi:PEP/pyruvate-binding domain-containing protein, partial [candidate division WOR-3 bacterium]|nr:PEP/pyruvate-binding domain-containing protein [candidate division WOR-3 bacterium]